MTGPHSTPQKIIMWGFNGNYKMQESQFLEENLLGVVFIGAGVAFQDPGMPLYIP